jgi:hypothetical protein
MSAPRYVIPGRRWHRYSIIVPFITEICQHSWMRCDSSKTLPLSV